jgi:hypothetical protein
MRLFLCLLLSAVTTYSQAADRPSASANLDAKQLDAIRSIGQNVLMAKRSAKKDQSNLANDEVLSQLRTTVDQLIAAETSAITATAQQANAPVNTASAAGQQTAAIQAHRETAKIAAWDTVSRLHQEAGQLQKTPKSAAKRQIYSGGFSMGGQRGKLYDRWAKKLAEILAKDRPLQISELMAFRDRLYPDHRELIAMPTEAKTPTLQALPWDRPSPKK